MCEYCENGKKIEENENDNIKLEIWYKHLYIQGKLFGAMFGRDILINYCPMCGKKLGKENKE